MIGLDEIQRMELLEFFLMIILTFLLNADVKGCDANQIATLANEYTGRYADVETAGDWQLLLDDLAREVDQRCVRQDGLRA